MGSTDVPMEEMGDKKVSFTEIKDYIMSFPKKTKLVRIHDACLKHEDLECLFRDGAWLDGDVSNLSTIYNTYVCSKFAVYFLQRFLQTIGDKCIHLLPTDPRTST